MTSLTITIDDETAVQIRRMAVSRGLSAEEVAAAAVEEAYARVDPLDLTSDQWAEVEKAIEETDRGEIATPEEVAAAFAEFRK